jgi:hypothetical protein
MEQGSNKTIKLYSLHLNFSSVTLNVVLKLDTCYQVDYVSFELAVLLLLKIIIREMTVCG